MATSTTVKKKKHGFLKFVVFIMIVLSVITLWKKNSIYDFKNSTLFSSSKTNVNASINDTYDNTSDNPGFGTGSGNSEVLNELYALAKEDKRINTVIEKIDDYPEELIQLLVKNPDAREFVLKYPEHLGDKSVGKINNSELNNGIPHFLQWDERWGYHGYGSNVLGITGCGPTCLSMIIVGLANNKNATPAAVADYSEQNGFYIEGVGTSWDLMSTGAESFGLKSTEVPLSEDVLIAELEAGHPLIVNVGPGDFTNAGHFIVITGYKNGMFTVNDPNSRKLSSEGWYYKTLKPQIKSIWAFSLL